jgi:glutamyl-tRNA reductase
MEWVKAQKLLGRLFPLQPNDDDRSEPTDKNQETKE